MANPHILHISCIPLLHPKCSQSTAVHGFHVHGWRFLFLKLQLSDSPKAWLWIEKLPTHGNQSLFAFDVDSTRVISLEIHPDGKLSFRSTAHEEPGLFPRATITKARWTHITLVHYTHRSLNPTIRTYSPLCSRECTKSRSGLFIDGVFCGGLNWPYPQSSTAPTSASYIIGGGAPDTTMRWCLSTSYLISVPLGQRPIALSAIYANITPKKTNYIALYIT